MKSRSEGVFSVLSTNRSLTGLLFLLVIVVSLAVYLFFSLNKQSSNKSQYVQHADELRIASQSFPKSAQLAADGKEQGFDELASSKKDFATHMSMLTTGISSTGLPPIDPALKEFSDVLLAWKNLENSTNSILLARDTVIELNNLAANMISDFRSIQESYNVIVDQMVNNGADAAQVQIAQRQVFLTERIIGSIGKLMEAEEGSVIAADSFAQDTQAFGGVLEDMINGGTKKRGTNLAIVSRITDSQSINQLQDVLNTFERVAGDVLLLLTQYPELFQVREGLVTVTKTSNTMLQSAEKLSEYFNDAHHSDDMMSDSLIWIVFGGITLIIISAIGFIIIRDTQFDLKRSAEANEQNQNAILRLLDELADLADGDLSTQATVTEDFTGAIADSINFAIDQMKGLVSAINLTALQVTSAAQETQATAMHLAEASEHQAQEIAGASAAVNEMAVSIDQVSANAAESSAVAERSVSIAKKGADVVQATINGMDNIREQIQETAKRIKRLGESSQEIGDIVSLINDIADQTNILALNAAIQASMAGDAGRGFAVVADEVQRLAERSSAATKQIEALVKTIQTDTNEAVISMEQTTAEVVRGARLAQDAGVALEEIENVSKNLADLIQNISNAARQQASSAGHISNTMNVIQEITSQTSAGTMATAKSIGNLNQLANEMRASVAGFKLPEGQELDVSDYDDDLMSA